MTLPISPEVYNAIQKLEPPVRDALMKILQEMESYISKAVASEITQVLSRVPKREEHDELKEALKLLTVRGAELAEAQKQTEKELNGLNVGVDGLTGRVNVLKICVNDLTMKVAGFVKPQRRTEKRAKDIPKPKNR